MSEQILVEVDARPNAKRVVAEISDYMVKRSRLRRVKKVKLKIGDVAFLHNVRAWTEDYRKGEITKRALRRNISHDLSRMVE